MLCLLLYHIGLSRIRNLVFRLRRIAVTRILAFHDIPDNWAGNFRAQIKVLKEQANVISLRDFFAGRLSWKQINVAITFDDGYQGWIDNASPVLKEFALKATFFVSSGLVGLREEEERDFFRNNLKSTAQTTGSLGVEGLRGLAEDGFDLGGHTWHHVNLTEISERNRLQREIQRDKENLERITGMSINYFAYPFGFHRNPHFDLAQILQEVGYQGAVATVPGFNTGRTNSFHLRRDLVNASLPLSVFMARVLGNTDAVMAARRVLRL